MTSGDSDFPESWVVSTLGESTHLVKAKVEPQKVPNVPYLGLEHVESQTMRILGRGIASDVKSTKTQFSAGDVLYGKLRPYLNKVAQPGFSGICSTDFFVFTESTDLDSGFLANYLNQSWVADQAHHLSNGVELPRVGWDSLATLPIAFPNSKADQRQIVDCIESARTMRESAAGHLDRADDALARFRRSVLASAISGRLTEAWRSRNEVQAGSDSGADLPTTWRMVAIGDVGEVHLGGTPSRKEPSFWNGGIPWVSSGEVANCRISATRESISAVGLDRSNAKMYPVGTVLIAMIGEGKTRGQSAILDIEACTNQNVAGIFPDRTIISPEYLWRWALAQYEITRAVGRGGNQPALNKQKVSELSIPVPPIDEQTEIVRRIDGLLAAADDIAARLNSGSVALDLSHQAVLGKAFRGELVAFD